MQFGWVDFSREERDKALGILQMLQEPGAYDELGIGVVRDAFADRFFPGTSTLLTRAKYYLLVPYILDDVISDGARREWTLERTLEAMGAEERKAGERLCEIHIGEKASGIIGRRSIARQGWVKRTPSELYWNGIRTFGICGECDLSLPQYVEAALAVRRERGMGLGASRSGKADEGDDIDAGLFGGLKPFDFQGLHPKAWRRTLGIGLTADESSYLRRKIMDSVPSSVLAIVLREHIDLNAFEGSFERFATATAGVVGETNRRLMDLAVRFMWTIYAARVRYNVILQGARSAEAAECWSELPKDRIETSPAFVDEMFMALGIDNRYQSVSRFLNRLLVAFGTSCEAVDDLICAREREIKGSARAKLEHPERYSSSAWLGGRFLDYRLGVMSRIVADISAGEEVVHA